jgi:hypothetical protein
MSNARFSILQARAVKDKRISDAQFRTLAALGMYADEDGWCYPLLSTLGVDLGKSKQAVGRDTIALRKLGYLEVTARYDKTGARKSSMYRLKFDLPRQRGVDTPSTNHVDTPSTSEVDVNVPINDPLNVEEEANPLQKFDDPQFGQIITDWNNLHTFLIPTHANLLGCMLDEWRSHVNLLPAGHPDKSLDPVAVFREAMIITGKNARNPHSLSYMDRVLKNWIHLGYGNNPNGKKPARTNGKTLAPTVADNWLARKEKELANGNS